MAVSRSLTVYAQYITSGSSFDGVLNGGEDYRTVNYSGGDNTLNVGYISWNWDTFKNMSRACKITDVTIQYSVGGRQSLQPLDKGDVYHYPVKCSGISISGNTINASFSSLGSEKSESFSGTDWSSKSSTELSGVSLSGLIGYSDPRLGMHIKFRERNNIANLQVHIKELRATIKYTAAAYATFTGDGLTKKTVTCDYGTSPSYGGTPTRSGYVFAGWKNGNATYTGSLPTIGEYDVTYTAVWIPTYTVKYNSNGATDGSVSSQTAKLGDNLTLKQNNFDKTYIVTFDDNHEGAELLDFSTSIAVFLGWEDHGNITSSSGRSFTYEQFDAPYYANTYADLKAAFGYNKLSLVDHYVNYGEKEGRKCFGNERSTYPENAVVNSLSTTAGATVELFAKWTKMSSFLLPSRSRDEYIFLGWFTAPSGGKRIGDGGEKYTPSGSITLYAHWEKDKTSFLYIKRNGSFVAAKAVYIKENGQWMQITDKTKIDTNKKYKIIQV